MPSPTTPLLLAIEAGEYVFHPTAASGAVNAVWLVPALPLLGFVVLIFAGRRLGRAAGWLATATVTGSFVVALAAFLSLQGAGEEARQQLVGLYTWIDVGGLELTTDLLFDPLSATLLLVITGVGGLVHLYSIGYMHHDERETRYFAYLNLFVFSMLVLVLASNFVVMFVGWELVGLCSYLLIGHWFEEKPNAVAAKKAFITNRVGDVSFSIGLFLIFATFGSLQFTEVLGQAHEVLGGQTGVALAIGLLLFGGAAGKSAQIPLYVWLPDAMAGPTPVSALIHAATMVTAGVYMIARTSVIYVESFAALDIVAAVGAATALLAALIAVQQDDIKKVLAYSTVSQLGYMVIGVGVGAFGAGIFHLVTHAFFKGLLFLAAGSVMHAVANKTDMWEMGGLRHAMPITFWTSVVAVLAISGIPPLAGFFSKDQILYYAFDSGHTVIWLVGLLTAGITAFYMTRWLIVPFLGEPRYDTDEIHAHESPWTMWGPLAILAVASFVGGFAINPTHGGPFETWLAPSVAHAEIGEPALALGETVLIALSVIVAVAGVGLAWAVYGRNPDRDPLPARLGALSTAMRRKFWVDEAYEFVFVRGGGAWSRFLVWFDVTVIDGAVNGAARMTGQAASGVRTLQVGLVRGYVAGVVLGTVALIAAFLLQVI